MLSNWIIESHSCFHIYLHVYVVCVRNIVSLYSGHTNWKGWPEYSWLPFAIRLVLIDFSLAVKAATLV